MEETMNDFDESRKRKREEEADIEIWNLKLSCYDESNVTVFDNECNKRQKMSLVECWMNMRVAETLKKFSVYTSEEEEHEISSGVSTKLKLCVNSYDSDPWKIKKVLQKSDCDHLYRLILGKDLVQNYILKVWKEGGKRDELAKISDKNGVSIKVWDYERRQEYELNFKHLSSSRSYIFRGAWHTKFVEERGLKKGDTIGLYWSEFMSRFVFSLIARAPVDDIVAIHWTEV